MQRHTTVPNTLLSAGGRFVTSPSKSKGQPKLKSFHEEKSPKMRMINGQSTESLESLSDELASNSGGNNSTAEPATGRRGHRVGPALYFIFYTIVL